MVVLGGGAVSYERGTPVGFRVQGVPPPPPAAAAAAGAPALTTPSPAFRFQGMGLRVWG